MSDFRIVNCDIGGDAPVFIIAEVGNAHDGSLGAAHAYIDAVAGSGAQAIKFQTHLAEAESSGREPFRVKFSYQDSSRYDYWKRLEFSYLEWQGLKEHAEAEGLIFLSTPFSLQAVDLLASLDVQAFKIPSGEVTNLPLLRAILETGKPILMSSGMSSWYELTRSVEFIRERGGALALFQCTTAYPVDPTSVGLNVLNELRERFQCPVGLSDHSGEQYAGIAASALGADLLEVHVTFSKHCFGPDTSSSIEVSELPQFISSCQNARQAALSHVCKDLVAEQKSDLKLMFGQSAFAARDLAMGEILDGSSYKLQKPIIGIKSSEILDFEGRELVRAVSKNEPLTEAMFHLGDES